uniref:Alternative protein ENPP2 n=1 Tax=Homo sapiens TaxID=9606 RepID=L8ECC9_HUMAN|nr:alternative protein ENPP2 [Homo sapiens]
MRGLRSMPSILSNLISLDTNMALSALRRVVMAHLLLRLRDLRGKLPLRGDRKDQLLLQRKEEEKYIGWIIMLRKLVRTK